jgi:hypothetical protein
MHVKMACVGAGDEVMGPFSEEEGKEIDDSDVPAGLSDANRHSAISPNLALALPATLNHKPADTAGMRDALFPSYPPLPPRRSGEEYPQRANKRRTAEGPPAPLRQDSLRPRLGAGLGREMIGAGEPLGLKIAPGLAAQPSRNAWVTAKRAVLPPAAETSGEALNRSSFARCPVSQSVDCGVARHILKQPTRDRDLLHPG